MRAEPARGRGKVVVLVSFMNKAGAQRAAHRVARGLNERGWDAELWFLYQVSHDAFDGCTTRVMLERPSPGVFGYLAIAWRVLMLMLRQRPDAVISFLPLASVVGQAAALLAGVPTRIASLRSPGTTFSTPMRLLDRLYGTVGVYTGIISVSAAVADEAADYPKAYRDRISVVYNGVEPITEASSQAEARKALGLPMDGVLALNIGRMAPQKNYPYLLEIAEHLKSTHLVFVGDGPQRDWITAEIARRNLKDRISVLGALPAERVPLAYRAADIFIQPSLFEGQSNTLLEAMTAPLPVMVSDVPSQTETVLDGAGGPHGFALPLDDARAWAAEIDRLANDPAARNHWAARAKARSADFTVSAQIDGFEAALIAPRRRDQGPAEFVAQPTERNG